MAQPLRSTPGVPRVVRHLVQNQGKPGKPPRDLVVCVARLNYVSAEAGVRDEMTTGASPSGADHRPRSEIAEMIALEATRLARIANANEFPFLARLIDMVVAEAWREASEPISAEAAESE
jgi:hypothetical protein